MNMLLVLFYLSIRIDGRKSIIWCTYFYYIFLNELRLVLSVSQHFWLFEAAVTMPYSAVIKHEIEYKVQGSRYTNAGTHSLKVGIVQKVSVNIKE